jgi:hypothetical protein
VKHGPPAAGRQSFLGRRGGLTARARKLTSMPRSRKGYYDRQMSLRYQDKIVSSWFDRRNRQPETPFDPFIYTWIALNAALSARYGRGGDRQKVNRFARDIAPHWTDWLRSDEILQQSASEFAAQSPIFQEPPRADGHRDHVNVEPDQAPSVMTGIYTVRNNLFHGAKEFDSDRDTVLVKSATQLLERVFLTSGLYDMANEPGRNLTERIE